MKTFLKILSVLLIVGAVALMVMGVICMAGAGSLTQALQDGGYLTGLGLDTTSAVAAGLVVGVVLLLGGVVSLVTGIFGYKGACGKKGMLTVALVLVLIGFVYEVYALIVSGVASASIVSAALSLLYLVVGFSVRGSLSAEQEHAA